MTIWHDLLRGACKYTKTRTDANGKVAYTHLAQIHPAAFPWPPVHRPFTTAEPARQSPPVPSLAPCATTQVDYVPKSITDQRRDRIVAANEASLASVLRLSLVRHSANRATWCTCKNCTNGPVVPRPSPSLGSVGINL